VTELRCYNYQVFFTEWKNWSDFNKEPMFNGINGVYAFRLTKVFGRLRGESSLLYIRSLKNSLYFRPLWPSFVLICRS
jgi:hypothetical protein